MRWLKWTFWLILLACLGLFLSYVLPKRDVIFITDGYSRFVEAGEYRGIRALSEEMTVTNGRLGADVLFIVGRSRDGALREFRNEDTGFGFPPYLKFDTATLDNQARESVSTPEAPKWMIVRYYGWRVPYLSMFPNMTSMKPAADKDVRLIPWFNIVFLTVLFAIFWAIRVRWVRFRNRRIKPVVDRVDAAVDDTTDGVSRWFASWRRKPPRP